MRTHPFSFSLRVSALPLIALLPLACTQTPQNIPTAPVPESTPTLARATPPRPAPTIVLPSANAASAAGTWTWTVDAAGNTITHTAVLKQDGEKLTGTFTDSFDNTTVDIKEGKIHEGQVTLTVVRPFQDATMTLNFTGILSGNAITGKMEFTIADQPTSADWNAKRGS